jgi:hypothetical protein
MADDIKFVIGVDDSDILTSIKNHQILEKRIEQLTKEYANLDKLQNTGRLSAQAYAKAVQKLDSDINQLSVALKKGGSAVNQLATGMNISGKAARRNEIAFQQAGYQVQDFIVQVQGGTNPLIAFSQQGSQLAGFFAGPWGAMIGLGIAALSSLAMAFLSTGEDAERLQKNLDVVGDKLDDFKKKVKSAEDTVSSFAYAMAQVQSTQIEAAWSELGDATAGSFEAAFMAKFGRFLYQNLWSGFQSWSSVTGTLAGENFAAAFGTSASILNDELLDQIGKAVKEQNIALLDSTIESLSAFSDMTVQGAQFLEYLIKVRDEANGFTTEVQAAAEELMLAKQHGEDISKLNLKLGIDEAQKVAELLAENMNISLQAALGLVGLARGAVMGGRGSDPRQFTYMDEFREQLQTKPTKTKKAPRKSGGAKTEDPAIKAKQAFDSLRASYDKTYATQLKIAQAQKTVNEAISIGGVDAEVANKAFEEYKASLEAVKSPMLDIANTMSGAMSEAFMSIADGTASVKDAFSDMVRVVIKKAFEMAVINPIINSIFGGVSGFNPLATFSSGGAFSNGSVQAYADGGVVGGPTTFPMSGGKTGLMGEAGPEAIMPLKRGANGKLGVQVEGNAGGDVNIVQNFNFAANGDDSVKKLIAQAAPQIANMTQKQIMDSRRRGGAMKSTFG